MQLSDNREYLYKLVWSKPVKDIASGHHVSEQTVIARCIALQILRPMPGYWDAVAKGKAPPVSPLPPLKTVKAGTLISSRDIKKPAPVDITARFNSSTQPVIKKSRKADCRTVSAVQLLQITKDILLKAPVTQLGFYKPAKRRLLDINVSNTGLEEAERFLLKLFAAIEKRGLLVRLAEASEDLRRREISACEDNSRHFFFPSLWAPSNESVICIEGICIGFSLIEMTENVPVKMVGERYVRDEKMISWSRGKHPAHLGYYHKEHIPCGRYRLQLYSPYEPEGWFKVFNQTKTCGLISQIPKIIEEVEAAVPVIKKQIQTEKERLVARHMRIQQELIEREERDAARLKEEARKASLTELQLIMKKWTENTEAENFLAYAENEIPKCEPAVQEQLRERLIAVRAFLKSESALQHLLNWRTPDERLK